jgi:hypothetical protein
MVRLLEYLVTRLNLRALPPFTFNAGLAVFAVGGGLLLPDWLGSLAGSLLAMQALVTISFYFLLTLLFARRGIRSEHRHREALQHQLEGWTLAFDCLVALFLLGSIAVGGVFGPVEFIVLAGTAYIGTGRDRLDARAVAEFGAGFVVAGAALLLVAVLFHLPEQIDHWAGARGSVAAAGCYFGTMAAAEAAGAFPRIAKGFLAIGEYAKRESERGG